MFLYSNEMNKKEKIEKIKNKGESNFFILIENKLFQEGHLKLGNTNQYY